MLKPAFCCFGANHKTASAEFRELMYLDPEQLQSVMKAIMQHHGFHELVVLSTCNRFEIYALSENNSRPLEDLLLVWADFQRHGGRQPPSERLIRKHTFFLEGQAAVEHVLAVAASLDSLIIGETQITGQFKKAFFLAADAGTLGPFLDRLCQDALAVVKKIRSKTKIGEKKVSISHAAIDLARKVFLDLKEHTFLIIGAGEMAKIAARYACSYHPRDLLVVNRTRSRAEALVQSLGAGSAHSWDNLTDCLLRSDIVISSTGARNPVISRRMLKKIMKERKGRSLFLVDIAIPRDIEPGCGSLDDVYLFEVDDLEKVVKGNLGERRREAERARVFVHQGAALYMQWLSAAAVKPVLASFRDYLEDLLKREAEKTLGRSLFHDLSEQQRQALFGMLRSVAGKILGDAAKVVNRPGEEALREQLASAIRLMFSRSPARTSVARQNLSDDKHGEDEASCNSQIIRL
ncbi:MAG: glutamyl-tRNA reductase [Deltaproteobacteria bacterium]|nr:glutamyl-tRNA reductase [Deltaproteobacteria bacterium]